MRVQWGTETAFEKPEPRVEIEIHDPDERVGKPNRGHPIDVAGETHYHGDKVEVDTATANFLVRYGAAELIGDKTVRVQIFDPHGAPKPYSFGVRIGGKHVEAGQRATVPLSMARDMIRNRTGVWPNGKEPRV